MRANYCTICGHHHNTTGCPAPPLKPSAPAGDNAPGLLDQVLTQAKEITRLTAVLEQTQAENVELTESVDDLGETAYKRLSKLRDAEDRIEQLEAALQEIPCTVLLAQKQPFDECFPIGACCPCHCGRSLIAGNSGK